MDDETDLLLDQFLAVASGERTEETRERYRRVLEPLRHPRDGEAGAGPGVRILLRIPPALQRVQADELDKQAQATAPSLWTRLVTWLRRNSDAGEGDASCAVLEAQARLRDVRERRREDRYSSLQWMPEMRPVWQPPPTEPDDVYRNEWGEVVPLVREPRWMPELY